MNRASIWRRRAGLFAVLGVLLLANAVILVSYTVFIDARFQALLESRKQLEARRDEARAGLDKARATEEKLASLRDDLEQFYGETLGTRRERLAPLIEEIYSITRKAGMRPDTISYAETPVPGADQISLLFNVSGKYADVKALLASFETNQLFLVLEGVSVALDDIEPDKLRVGLTVTHYFRSDKSRVPRGGRSTMRKGSGRGAPGGRPAPPPRVPHPAAGGQSR